MDEPPQETLHDVERVETAHQINGLGPVGTESTESHPRSAAKMLRFELGRALPWW